MLYHQARALLPPGRTWLAYYGDHNQPGFEEWYRASGRTFVLRQMAWGEWTAYGIRAPQADLPEVSRASHYS